MEILINNQKCSPKAIQPNSPDELVIICPNSTNDIAKPINLQIFDQRSPSLSGEYWVEYTKPRLSHFSPREIKISFDEDVNCLGIEDIVVNSPGYVIEKSFDDFTIRINNNYEDRRINLQIKGILMEYNITPLFSKVLYF
jgi:hypothetical protein